MRRKSTRNVQKQTPEKPPAKETEVPKTRRSRRRKRSPSKSTDSDNEVLTVTKRAPLEETPDTTTKSHTPSGDEGAEEPVWKVTSAEDTPRGEIQKLRISLTRPSPESPDKSKARRSKSNSQTEDDATSSEDKSSSTRRTRSRGSPFVRNDGFTSQGDEDVVDEKKGKGKSKGKHKSKIEQSPQLSESAIKANSEISENVQVTPQSPTIDKPVDNENDYKVDVHDKQSVNDRRENDGEESASNGRDSCNELVPTDINQRDSDDDQPLSVIQKIANEKQKVDEQDELPIHTEETVTEIEQQSSEEKQEAVESSQTTVEPSQTAVEPTQTAAEPSQAAVEPSQTAAEPSQAAVEPSQTAAEPSQGAVEPPQAVVEPSQAAVADEQNVGDENQTTAEIQTSVEKESPLEGSVAENEPTSDKEVEIVEKTTEKLNQDESEDTAVAAEEANPQKENVQETTVEAMEVSEIEHEQVEDEVAMEVSVELTENADKEQSEKHSAQLIKTQIVSTETSEEISSSKTTEEPNRPVDESTEQLPRRRLKRDFNSIIDSTEAEKTTSGRIVPSKIQRNWSAHPLQTLVKVDLESVQVLFPSIEYPEEPDLNLDVVKELRRSSSATSVKKLERKVSVDYKSDNSDRPSYEKQASVSSSVTPDVEDNSNIIAFNRKISIVDDTASKLKPPPSPAKNPVSNVLYITNLVRPFTLKQLRELLERTGKIQEEGFWTDRIKSKCYVNYETQEEAEATRNALHGVQWPIGNGKNLIIEFGTEEDLNNAKNPPPPPAPSIPVAEIKTTSKENLEPMEIEKRNEEKTSKEIEKKRSEGPVREWDIGKKDLLKERSRSRDRNRKHRRSPTPTDDFISRKQRKVEESVPQKLMDDLFLKTKATPSIYWQPLSPEEIAMKQQQRLIRMEEHKRRIEENTRFKGREMGRGAFRRRYD